MNERDENLLFIIKDDANLLLKLIEEYDFQSFVNDDKMKLATSMSLINLGESVKSLSKELKQAYPDVQWGSITGLRNIAAHEYRALRMVDVWEIVTKDVPELLEQVNGILIAEGVEEGE
jgi:uncharacterized protein with HEPN domain